MSPEVVHGKGHSKSVDWWSLGLLIYEMLAGSHPFKSKRKNRQQIFNQITDEPVQMLPGFSEEASDLLTRLLKIDPEERLGSSETDAEEIKSHEWFKKVDWTKIKSKQQSPPYKP